MCLTIFLFQIVGGSFFPLALLTTFQFDIDIELLSDDNFGTGNVCEGQIPTQGFRKTFQIPNENENLSCRNADAINLLTNELINIGDDEPEFINFEECNGEETPQCQNQNQRSGGSQDRVIDGIALKYASPVVGQSFLRSQPAQSRNGEEGCPSSDMCVRRRGNGQKRCCALVVIRGSLQTCRKLRSSDH